MRKIKKIVFDMDGTIADLYGRSDWLERIQGSRPVFADLQPMVNMEEVNSLCEQLEEKGYEIIIITWTPMYASKNYKNACRLEKKEWLKKYFPMVKNIHMVQYGTYKHHVIKGIPNALLFDDNMKIRKLWKNFGGVAKNETKIIETLKELLAC